MIATGNHLPKLPRSDRYSASARSYPLMSRVSYQPCEQQEAQNQAPEMNRALGVERKKKRFAALNVCLRRNKLMGKGVAAW